MTTETATRQTFTVRDREKHLIGRIYIEPSGRVWTADVYLLDKLDKDVDAFYALVHHLTEREAKARLGEDAPHVRCIARGMPCGTGCPGGRARYY